MTAKPSTSARGYDAAHKHERAKWKPVVERGDAQCHAVNCLETSRHIPPDATWHLGHTPDRTAWTGPEHERCNTSEGATRGNAQRRHTPQLVLRDW